MGKVTDCDRPESDLNEKHQHSSIQTKNNSKRKGKTA
jgi:hypothetical protein